MHHANNAINAVNNEYRFFFFVFSKGSKEININKI